LRAVAEPADGGSRAAEGYAVFEPPGRGHRCSVREQMHVRQAPNGERVNAASTINELKERSISLSSNA
jgi:hypothetical protein